MERLTLTSFGRQPVSAGQLAAQMRADMEQGSAPVSKWDVLRDTTTARAMLGITDRDLCVLQALLSFHPAKELGSEGPIVVFPSNKSLSERAHGMPESTLRRHLSKLVNTGLILRHDSPNGKRYARKGQGGVIALAFGFDLSPLVHRAIELANLAQTTRAEAAKLAELRERCVLMVRDATKLIAFTETTDERLLDALKATQRHLRRQPTLDGLTALEDACKALLTALRQLVETEEVIANDDQNERHHKSHNTNNFDSELAENAELAKPMRTVPLPVLLKTCPEIERYAGAPIHDWVGLIRQAAILKTMIGISEDAWEKACYGMGACEAASVVAYLLERLDTISNPGGYLRTLTNKAEMGELNISEMIMSLIEQDRKCAA